MDPYFVSGDGVLDGEDRCHEGNLLLREGRWCSVTQIPEQGMSEVGHLDADLVMATGFEINFDQAVRCPCSDHLIEKPGLLTGPGRCRKNATGPIFLSFEMVSQKPGGHRRESLDNGEIMFPDFAGTKLFTDASGRFGSAAEKHHSGRRPVETMHQSEEGFTFLPAAFLQPGFSQVQKGHGPGVIALNEQPCWFIKRQEVVVLIQHRPGRVIEIGVVHHASHNKQ